MKQFTICLVTKSLKKYGDDKRKKLEKYDLKKLPKFIQNNENKLKEWMD